MKTNWPAMQIGCLIFASAALASSPCFAQAQEPAGATATASVISSVAVTQVPERASVRVEGAGPLQVRAARFQNPDRLVLDFNGTRLAVHNTVIPGVSAPVRGVRLGQFKPDVARVVIDLTAAAPYQISHEGTTVVVSFAAPPASPAESTTAATKIASEDLRGTKPAFHYEMAAPRNVALRSTKASRVSAPRFALPGELTQPSFVLASFGGRNEPARPSAQAALQQAGSAASTLANSQASQGSQASPAAVASGRYTGEPISVNLKDVDLKDFFRLIHEISGLNVVLDPTVHGTLTVVLDDVPWDQALDIVLKNNDLARELEGNVLRIATVDTLKHEADARRAQIESEALAVEKVSVTRFLSYAKAADAIVTVKKFLSQRGDVVADARTNAVIINDIPKVIPIVDRLMTQLDRKTQEVEIEARVVAATRQFARDIGTQLGFGWGDGHSAIGGNQAVGASPTTVGGLTPGYITVPGTGSGGGSSIPLFSNLGVTSPSSGLSFVNASNNIRIDAVLSMAESRGLLKILSRPRVVTQNNIQALVRQGVRVPIVTQAQLGGPPTVTYVDAFLRLTVTPQITSENTIFLNVDVENTTPNFGQEV